MAIKLAIQPDGPDFRVHKVTQDDLHTNRYGKVIAQYIEKDIKIKVGSEIILSFCNQFNDSTGKVCGQQYQYISIKKSAKTNEPLINIKYSNMVGHSQAKHKTRWPVIELSSDTHNYLFITFIFHVGILCLGFENIDKQSMMLVRNVNVIGWHVN